MGIILTAIYALIIVFLIKKLRDIRSHPHKYDAIPGYEGYRKSTWYWPPKQEYRKGTPPDNCGMVCGILMVLVYAWYILSCFLFHQLKAMSADTTVVFDAFNDWAVVCIPVVFCHALALSYYAPMFSKKPVAICFNLHCVFRKDSRSTAWEKMTKLVLVSFIVIFPFRMLSLYNYGYVTDEKIVYSPFFSFREQVFDYYEIEVAEIVYDEDGNVSKFYIQNPHGDRLDVLHDFCCVDTDRCSVSTLIMNRLPEEMQIPIISS